MEKKNKIRVKPVSIRNILTIRYDITEKTVNKPATIQDFKNSFNDQGGYMTEKLLNNSFRQIREYDKFSISLSGGIDSSLCLALLRNNFPKVKITTISGVFENAYDESTHAKKLAEKFDADFHPINMESIYTKMPEIVYIAKKPKWNTYNHLIAKQAKKVSKILVTGDGGDEVFGGYTFRYKKFLSMTNHNSTPLEKAKSYLLCHERDRVPDQEKLFGKKSKFSWEFIYETLIDYFDNTLSPIEQVFLADYNGKLLYNFNPINTKILNHFSVKPISPLLSDDMVSYALGIPSQYKYDQTKNIGKLSLRKILSKYNIDKLIPNEKLGFNVNTLNLWTSFGQSLCKEYLIDSEITKDGWINKDWINKYIDRTDLDVRYVNKFLGLLAFEVWYRLFVTKDISANTTLN